LYVNINRYGNWGVCFIYATFFALKGLEAGNKTLENSETVRKAVEFLLTTQHPDGGWGESFLSCPTKVIQCRPGSSNSEALGDKKI
jgi:squalene cyclase